ncbi:MAG: ABC transporter substrate-binding protein [Proteobacteria bacterium]|nr:ABC transporter substrate-binding protein [Pseudomonadota bacterium]
MKRCVLVQLLVFSVALCLPVMSQAGNVHIRFGILPVLDTLPLQVAATEGFFAAQGLDVELISFNSALERDVALQTGQLDGYFGDLVAAVLLLQNGVTMPVALTSYHTTPGQPMFGIATGPALKNATLADLKGKKIGYSKATIMEFLLEQLLLKNDLPADYFERVEVKKVPIRMQMVLQDQLDCALLPEALLSLVKFKGGGLALTAENLDIPLTILGLHEKYFADNGAVYKKFVAAYTQAVAALADTPEKYRDLMGKTCHVPPPLLPEFPIFRYPAPELPSQADVQMVTAWMKSVGMLKGDIAYADVVAPMKP